MEIDNPNKRHRSTSRTGVNGLDLRPVSSEESGEGLPYAPENWPNPGDNWGWKTGRRVANSGYFMDRYLYLPKHLRHLGNSTSLSKRYIFASKLSVERFIREVFPGADVNAFFASFSWKIRAKNYPFSNGKSPAHTLSHVPCEEIAEVAAIDGDSEISGCKIRNPMCSLKQDNMDVAPSWCHGCCDDEKFCYNCCCILCKKTVNSTYGGFSYMKCEAKVGKDDICGHIAHLECAIQCYLAGTVGGCFDIDAEYICRRCDAKTSLLPHVEKLLATCKSINRRDDIQKILDLGICILRGSKKERAKILLKDIESAIKKLKCGTSLEDIWRQENGSPSLPGAELLH